MERLDNQKEEEDLGGKGLFREVPIHVRDEDTVSDLSIDAKEQIIDAIGGFGRWQLKKCLFIAVVIWMPASFHLLNMVFFRAETDYWCTPPRKFAFDVGLWRNFSNPGKEGQQCFQYDVDYESFSTLQDALDVFPPQTTRVRSSSILDCAKFQSFPDVTGVFLPRQGKHLNEHAVAMETWRAFHSQDGPDGSRNALGQVLFPSNVATRSTS
eukprot:maker-scaffold1236_size70259-snap-gene-0.18 protein:Tk09131 transcript:maker-scaffold1236_size70259-snap-gene-0.18-mRNA-1 annotation:"conserved hypothetical protein"